MRSLPKHLVSVKPVPLVGVSVLPGPGMSAMLVGVASSARSIAFCPAAIVNEKPWFDESSVAFCGMVHLPPRHEIAS